MKARGRSIALSLVILLCANAGHAVVGCLAEVPTLIPKATTIVAGRIDKVRKLRASTCEAVDPSSSKLLECGQVFELRFRVSEDLLGTTSDQIKVLVSSPAVKLSCDDRPPIEQMQGLYAVLFLRSRGQRLSTIEGANSIYASRERDPQFISQLKNAIAGYYSVDGRVDPTPSTVRGTVLDPTGAKVRAATVTFENREHRKFEVQTSQDGTYSIHLEPDWYTVEASRDGFCVMKRGEFFLDSGATAEFDFDLVLCSSDSSRKPYEVEELPALDNSSLKPLIQYGFRKGDGATEYVGIFQQGYYVRPVLSYDVWTLRADSITYEPFNRTVIAEGNVTWQDQETTQGARSIRVLLARPPKVLKIDP